MSATLKDVAARAGVSTSAVSRTFTDGASVSGRMRERVMKAANELGYSPNVLASSLTTRRTKLIGLVADNFTNPLFLNMIDRFTRLIQDRGFRPLLVNLAEERDPQQSLQLLRQYSVDGVIVASSTLPASFAAAFEAAGLPVVHTFGQAEGSAAPVVGVDNLAIGRMAAETLLSRGYKDVGFLGGPESASSTRDRMTGFETGIGRELSETRRRFCSSYSYEAGRDAMRQMLEENDLPGAVFCGDDVIAVGAMDALREARWSVPDDIGMLGVNDMDMAGWRMIDLTTIRQPVDEIISASVDMVIGRIEAPETRQASRIVPCTLIERGSLR